MLNFGRRFCCLLLYFVMFWTAFGAERNVVGQSVYSWDFSDCEIRDILYVVSLDTGI